MAERNTARSSKRVSVMAWIEDTCGGVVFVRQAKGSRRWSLPGGKVKSGEALVNALRREVREEIGCTVASAAPLDLLDRPRAGSVSILYRVLLKPGPFKARAGEIEKIAVRRRLPEGSSEAAAYFWRRARHGFYPFSLFSHPVRGSRTGTA